MFLLVLLDILLVLLDFFLLESSCLQRIRNVAFSEGEKGVLGGYCLDDIIACKYVTAFPSL